MRSFFDLFSKHAESTPDHAAARFKEGGAWHDLTWRELAERVDAVSAGLLDLGLEVGERIAIFSGTRLEWTLADLGIVGAGGVTVSIYQSNTPAEAAYILNDSQAVVVVAEDDVQLAKLREVRGEIAGIRRVVVVDPRGAELDPAWETSWRELVDRGAAALGRRGTEIADRRSALAPDSIATLIYTSGTTGQPKGVIVTHDNLVYCGEAVEAVGLTQPDDLQLLFLPLAHSFAKVLVVTWLSTGSVLAFAESLDKLVENMAEVRPTLVASVPRLFEKMHARVVSGALSQPGVKGKLAAWAFAQGEMAAKAEERGERPGGLAWWLARKLVWKKVGSRLRDLFGGRLRFFVSGGAPLAKDIAYFFKHAGVMICEGYGLTETSSITTVNRPGQVEIGTVGPPFAGVELRIAEDGEIMIRGRSVFRGYWRLPEATAEVLRPDGWFLTGDIGEIDAAGRLRITDRKKDLIVTAGGKNVAPQYLENLLKSRSPLISQVVVHGDRRPYLVALLTLDEASLGEWAKERGLAGDFAALTRRPDVRAEVERLIEQVNRELPRYETLKRFVILDHDFTVGDQLTPTLKVRRKVCARRYGALLDELYEVPAPVAETVAES